MMDEQDSIQSMKNGDIAGLEALVQRYQLKAVRTAYLITRDPHMAEDVAQEAFLQAFRAIRSFDATRAFEPWFMRSVVNAALKAAQKAARREPVDLEEAQERFEALIGRAESAEEAWLSADLRNEIRAALDQLSPRQRAVIVQRYFLEMSEKEMAEQLEAAPGTVKWLLNAARARLRGLLSERSVE